MFRDILFRENLTKRYSSVTEERNKTEGVKEDGMQTSKNATSIWHPCTICKLKRESSQIVLDQTRERKKQKVEGMEEAVDTMDRISDLPEHIIHHIISRLRCPKDVARTSVLSKRWRSLWISFSIFNFDQRCFPVEQHGQINTFKRYVDHAMETRLGPMFSLQKLKLHLTCFNFNVAQHMNKWISAAIDKKVKDLQIHLDVIGNRRYILPQAVFTSKTITSLKLHGCKFNKLGDIKLPNLIELSIKKAHVKDSVIQNFISGCRLIEDLRFVECSCFDNLLLSNLPKLVRLEVHECHGLRSLKIQAPNLQSFWYHGKRSIGQCRLNLVDCENLKILTLKDTYMTDEVFQGQISKFPVLEKLMLHECNRLERITIISRRLEKLSLIRCRNLMEANIDVPNLSQFEYTGGKVPFTSMTISSLQEAKLYFESKNKHNSQLTPEIQKFLRKLEKLCGFKCAVCSDKAVTIYEELKEINIDSINDFKLEITKSSAMLKDYVDNLLRASQPKKLSIISSPSSEFLKFIHDKIENRVENPICCKYYSRKCWRHYLEDVKIKCSEEAENNKSSALDGCSTSSLDVNTSFNLKWKSRRPGSEGGELAGQ